MSSIQEEMNESNLSKSDETVEIFMFDVIRAFYERKLCRFQLSCIKGMLCE